MAAQGERGMAQCAGWHSEQRRVHGSMGVRARARRPARMRGGGCVGVWDGAAQTLGQTGEQGGRAARTGRRGVAETCGAA